MGVRVGELDPRQMDRLRGELAELLAAECVYPPYFDYRSGQRRTRPLDRERREDVDQFLRSASFTQLQAMDIASPELRRFIEQLLLRYLQVNTVLNHAHIKRRLAEMRSRTPKLAGELQRGLVAHVNGTAPHFGARRQQPTWASAAGKARSEPEQLTHNTRVLEAILLRPLEAQTVAPSAPTSRTAAEPAPMRGGKEQANGAGNHEEYADATIPVPAQGWEPPGASSPGATSPFAGLESGAQSAMFGVRGALTELPTGPLPPHGGQGDEQVGQARGAPAREISPELYQIYGDYLRDMQPEAFAQSAPAPHAEPALLRSLPTVQREPERPRFMDSAPARPTRAEAAPTGAQDPRGDGLIFWQLRYQLEAYIKRAVKSYGIQVRSDDPSGVLDSLRRSGFVDEADLRIAESILAITDRVTAAGTASTSDYREALMLYLLYHRSHLGT